MSTNTSLPNQGTQSSSKLRSKEIHSITMCTGETMLLFLLPTEGLRTVTNNSIYHTQKTCYLPKCFLHLTVPLLKPLVPNKNENTPRTNTLLRNYLSIPYYEYQTISYEKREKVSTWLGKAKSKGLGKQPQTNFLQYTNLLRNRIYVLLQNERQNIKEI